LINLLNRNIVGYSAGSKNDAALVYEAFLNSSIHLSKKGCHYDNPVAEVTYKVVKRLFTYKMIFTNLDELKMKLRKCVLWYNNKRIHGSLSFMTPVEYRLKSMTE